MDAPVLPGVVARRTERVGPVEERLCGEVRTSTSVPPRKFLKCQLNIRYGPIKSWLHVVVVLDGGTISWATAPSTRSASNPTPAALRMSRARR